MQNAEYLRLREIFRAVTMHTDLARQMRAAGDASIEDCEWFAYVALTRNLPDMEVALHSFVIMHDFPATVHEMWVHSLSHLLDELWKRRMMDWLLRYYSIALAPPQFPRRHSSSDHRLVYAFLAYSIWSDHPADFHITRNIVRYVNLYGMEDHLLARLEASPFASEEAFESWKRLAPPLFHRQMDWRGR